VIFNGCLRSNASGRSLKLSSQSQHKEHLTTLNSLINSTGILHLKSIFNFIISSRGNVELKLLYPFALIAYLDNMNVNSCIKSIKSSNSTRFRWKGVFLGVAIFIYNIKYSSGS